jgi:membrane protease YdiL (CAAX protease family)
LVIIALLPAIGEEVVFRGVLQRQVQRVIFPTWLAILIAAAIFSAIHLQFEGFLSRWLLGVLLGWLYWQTGNLWVPAIAHFFNNAIQVLGQYLYKNDISTVDLEKDIDVPWYFALVSLVLVLWIIRNNASTSNNT